MSFDLNSEIDRLAAAASREVAAAVENGLVTYIEAVEGRVPTNAELMALGQKSPNDRGGTDYFWRGVRVVSVYPLRSKAFGWQIEGTNPP